MATRSSAGFRLTLPNLKELATKTFANFSEDNAPRLAAAFAFYAILSLAPLLVVAVSAVGWFLGSGDAERRILHQAAAFTGGNDQVQAFLAQIVDQAQNKSTGILATIISLSVTFFSASNLFLQLEDSVNTIWGIKQTGPLIRNLILTRIAAFVGVLLFGGLLVAWLALDSWLGWLSAQAPEFIGWRFVSFLVTVAFLTLGLGVSIKAMPRDRLQWSDVWVGAFIAAFGVALMKLLFSVYVRFSKVDAAFGTAGALAVLLLWIYYTAMVYFFGLEVTYTYAHRFGSLKGKDSIDDQGLQRS